MPFLQYILRSLFNETSEGQRTLEQACRLWRERRSAQTSLLDNTWEERVMYAVSLLPLEAEQPPDWLEARFRPLALANIAIIFCALLLLWHAGDPGTALADYAQVFFAGYEVFF